MYVSMATPLTGVASLHDRIVKPILDQWKRDGEPQRQTQQTPKTPSRSPSAMSSRVKPNGRIPSACSIPISRVR